MPERPVFERLSGDGPLKVNVIGRHGQNVVLSDAVNFSPPYSLSIEEAYEQYGIRVPTQDAEQEILNRQAAAAQQHALRSAARHEPTVNVGSQRKFAELSGLNDRTPEERFRALCEK